MRTKFVWGSFILIAVIGAAILINIHGSGQKQKVEEEPSIPILTYTVEVGKLPVDPQYSGKLESSKEIKIIPSVLSEVVALYVKEGDWVEEGEPLMDLDTTKLEAQIAKVRADIEQTKTFNESFALGKEKTQTTIKKLDDQIEDIQIHLDKLYGTQSSMYAGPTYKKDITALEEQASALKILKQTLETLSLSTDNEPNRLALLEENYKTLLDLKDQYHMVSPITGRISTVNIQQGEVPSFQLPALEIESAECLKFEISVSKAERDDYKIGDLFQVAVEEEVKVEAQDLQEKDLSLKGEVIEISEEPLVKTGLYTITFSVENPDSVPLIGAFGKVSIPLEMNQETTLIPIEGLICIANRTYVYVLNETKPLTVIRRQVVVGRESEGHIEILEGLNKGETIVLEGNAHFMYFPICVILL